MNERIRLLAEQATKTINVGGMYEHFDKEKFAELIINECLFFMAQGDVDFAKWQIKKEFGVEV